MSSNNYYHKGLKCSICGRPLATEGKDPTAVFSVDHIVPQSVDKDTLPIRLQAMCKRCNGLKSNAMPTAMLYRIIGSFRYLEDKYPELQVKSITVKDLNQLDRIYKVHTQCGMCFEIPSNGDAMTCRTDVMTVLPMLHKAAGDLDRIKDYIVYGALPLGG